MGYYISNCVLACDTVLYKVHTSELFNWINNIKTKQTRKQQKNLRTFDLVLGHFHSCRWLQAVHGPHTGLPIAPSHCVLCFQGTHVFVLLHAALPYVCLSLCLPFLTSASPYACLSLRLPLLTPTFPYVCWSWSGNSCCSHPLKRLPTWILQLWPFFVFCVKTLCCVFPEGSPSRGRSSSAHLIHLHLNKFRQANLEMHLQSSGVSCLVSFFLHIL